MIRKPLFKDILLQKRLIKDKLKKLAIMLCVRITINKKSLVGSRKTYSTIHSNLTPEVKCLNETSPQELWKKTNEIYMSKLVIFKERVVSTTHGDRKQGSSQSF